MQEPYLEQMVKLWTTMGMGYDKVNQGDRKDVQKKRIDPMLGFFKSQFEDLIKNDKKHLNDLMHEIEKHEYKRQELRRILSIKSNDAGEENLSLIDLEKKLRDEVTQLQNEKDNRMKAYDDARAEENIECESTGSAPCDIVIKLMPTDEQVNEIKKYTTYLRVTFKNKLFHATPLLTKICFVHFKSRNLGIWTVGLSIEIH